MILDETIKWELFKEFNDTVVKIDEDTTSAESLIKNTLDKYKNKNPLAVSNLLLYPIMAVLLYELYDIYTNKDNKFAVPLVAFALLYATVGIGGKLVGYLRQIDFKGKEKYEYLRDLFFFYYGHQPEYVDLFKEHYGGKLPQITSVDL